MRASWTTRWLPHLQLDFVLTAAVAAESKHADAAKAFLAFLKTEEAAAVFKAKGVMPK